jgi:hypothetical protein
MPVPALKFYNHFTVKLRKTSSDGCDCLKGFFLIYFNLAFLPLRFEEKNCTIDFFPKQWYNTIRQNAKGGISHVTICDRFNCNQRNTVRSNDCPLHNGQKSTEKKGRTG